MSSLPILTYSTAGLPEPRAFAEWQAVMAPLFEIDPARFHGKLPRGSTTSIMIGDVIANRTVFTAQHLSRKAALIDATPDHLLLQAYIAGGFHGELDGRTVTVGRGMVAVTDLRRTVDVRAATSDTVGLALPRSFAAQVGADALNGRLDPSRNRQLADWILAFYRRLPRLGEADVPALTAEIADFLQRLCDALPGDEATMEPVAEPDLLARAEHLIQISLGSPDLLPASLADRLGVSRATLYRLFAPLGGVRRQIQERRLAAAHAALSDPLEPRGLGQLASEFGFGSAALFSRSFRARFGQSPDAYRAAIVHASGMARPNSPDPVRAWWARLGQ